MKLTASKIVLPAAALLLVAWWIVREPASPEAEDASRESLALPEPADPDAMTKSATLQPAGQIPGYSAPPIQTATPAEVAALVQAEIDRSARSEPPKTFIGIDGKPKTFQYNTTPEQAAREDARDARRRLLMQQLKADPQRFAHDNQLTLKEVQWIVDGTGDFPDRMLD